MHASSDRPADEGCGHAEEIAASECRHHYDDCENDRATRRCTDDRDEAHHEQNEGVGRREKLERAELPGAEPGNQNERATEEHGRIGVRRDAKRTDEIALRAKWWREHRDERCDEHDAAEHERERERGVCKCDACRRPIDLSRCDGNADDTQREKRRDGSDGRERHDVSEEHRDERRLLVFDRRPRRARPHDQ